MPSMKNAHHRSPAAPASIENSVGSILKALGEDPNREGLKQTPKRYTKALEFLTSGYKEDIDKIVGTALYHETSDEIVLIRDIELFSLCEHHLLPFVGRAHVAYIPDKTVIGLSKIPRIVDAFARRLQLQERLTQQIAEALMNVLKPRGVAVIIEASWEYLKKILPFEKI
jgi:GTP cyclohydrolase I